MDTGIRDGSSHDVDRCVRLWTRIIAARDGAAVAPAVEREALAAFARPGARFAVIGTAPTAFALTVAGADRTALLSRLCVDPAATSRGLGTALVADAVEHARAAGFLRIDLDVRCTNERAIALYARAGFIATSAPWDHDGGDRLVTYSLELADGPRNAASSALRACSDRDRCDP